MPAHHLESRINTVLDGLDLDHSASGYLYLMHAIELLCNDEEMRNTRRVMPIYAAVAKRDNTTSSRVEFCIRMVLKRAGVKKSSGKFIFWAVDSAMFIPSNP